MGANRKLQIEIDRTLKKVSEGIEIFDEIWEKVYETDQLPLKEKYEADLKKEIKKLQRYRDTIKTWISGSDIKDKSSLIEARKSVERQMERFKVCEKETKTKMFSKEGLAQAQKQDPKEKAKNEMRDWINTTVDVLTAEVENFDAEVEQLQPGKKKGKPPPRLVHAEESANRHRAHIQRLEQILRLLDNEAIDAEDVQEAKELVDDYLTRNQDDFEEFGSPDDLYADLIDQLDNLEAQQPVAVNHIGKGVNIKEKENKEREKEREKERSAALAMKMQLAQGGLHVVMEESPSPEKPIAAVAVKKPPDPPARPAAPKATVPPAPALKLEAKEAAPAPAAAAPEVSSEVNSNAPESTPSTPGRGAQTSARHDPSTSAPAQVGEEQRQAPGLAGPVSAAPGAPTPALPAGTASFAAAAAAASGGALQSDSSLDSTGGSYGPDQNADSRKKAARGTQPVIAGVPPGQPAPPQPQFSAAAAAASGQPQQGALGFQLGRPAAQGQEPPARPITGQAGAGKRSEESAGAVQVAPQSTMAELSSEGRPAAATSVPPMGYSQSHLHLLQASATRSLPTMTDRLWGVKAVRPRLLTSALPTSYPDSKIPILENPQLFQKLESEALFFAFYYQPETYQQYLAARELKRQSWRYHKQHGAWFQRHEEPKTATEEFEQGTYVYFDYNIMHDDLQSGWCYRLKQDFTFRYDALEDELQV